uniref:Uncharacterized protein n=1 Tax=Trypanosoma vivax (strain Y486) TaxID=1055687 RepID=G0U4M6_TRYVY|nr:hypothetical protein, conserved in T. vivax [Trypanosoma vivax Y486]
MLIKALAISGEAFRCPVATIRPVSELPCQRLCSLVPICARQAILCMHIRTILLSPPSAPSSSKPFALHILSWWSLNFFPFPSGCTYRVFIFLWPLPHVPSIVPILSANWLRFLLRLRLVAFQQPKRICSAERRGVIIHNRRNSSGLNAIRTYSFSLLGLGSEVRHARRNGACRTSSGLFAMMEARFELFMHPQQFFTTLVISVMVSGAPPFEFIPVWFSLPRGLLSNCIRLNRCWFSQYDFGVFEARLWTEVSTSLAHLYAFQLQRG